MLLPNTLYVAGSGWSSAVVMTNSGSATPLKHNHARWRARSMTAPCDVEGQLGSITGAGIVVVVGAGTVVDVEVVVVVFGTVVVVVGSVVCAIESGAVSVTGVV